MQVAYFLCYISVAQMSSQTFVCSGHILAKLMMIESDQIQISSVFLGIILIVIFVKIAK